MAAITKARMELEELYMGVPDESVNLTFRDLPDAKKSITKARMELEQLYLGTPDESVNPTFRDLPEVKKIGSEPSNNRHRHHRHLDHGGGDSIDFLKDHLHHHHHHHLHVREESRWSYVIPNYAEDSLVSYMSGVSMASMYPERSGRWRRPGIPHSNICTVCSIYIYIFRHRCLVCGRVYCRNCSSMGMGEMTEGRKCVECLGLKFSQRYIRRAGKLGCCSNYPSIVKQAELIWAERGPRRARQRVYGRSPMMSISRSPVNPRTLTGNQASHKAPIGSPYSPYSSAYG